MKGITGRHVFLTGADGFGITIALNIALAVAWTGEAFAADVDLAPGVWAMRLEARAADGSLYQRRLEIGVRR